MMTTLMLCWLMVVPFKKNIRTVDCNDMEQPSLSCIHLNSELEKIKSPRIMSPTARLKSDRILYFDDDVVFVNKPSNLQTVPGHLEDHSLATIIQRMFDIPNIEHMSPHRLDYQTSGVVVFARTRQALINIQEQFRVRDTVYKRYTAVVSGKMKNLEGEIDLPIGKDEKVGPPLMTISPNNPDGRIAYTQWSVLEIGNTSTKISLLPHTGRTHQLRLHMAAIGHPILGDFFYSPPDVYRASKRLMLHAEQLRLKHPKTQKSMCITAPCPLKFPD